MNFLSVRLRAVIAKLMPLKRGQRSPMSEFQIKQLPYDLSSHAGLALVGAYFKHIHLNALVDPAFPVRSGVTNSAIIKSYVVLLCQGKSDFEPSRAFAVMRSSSARWAGRACPPAPRCAGA